RVQTTENFHFFTELAQRIIRAASQIGPRGRLYQVDMRLRPTGKSGSLVIPLAEFERYFACGSGEADGLNQRNTAQVWERQALTQARPVYGDASFGEQVMQAVELAAYGLPWSQQIVNEIVAMRDRIQASGGVHPRRDLKRCRGGLIDIEFLVQLC